MEGKSSFQQGRLDTNEDGSNKKKYSSKRDRPLSGYFDAPISNISTKLVDFFSSESKGINNLKISDLNSKSQENNRNSFQSDNESSQIIGDITLVDEEEPTDVEENSDRDQHSPLISRSTFRNLTNLVSIFDIPGRKSTKGTLKKQNAHNRGNHSDDKVKLLEIFQNKNCPSFDQNIALPKSDDSDDDYNEGLGSPVSKHNKCKNLRRYHSMVQTSKEMETYCMEDNSFLSKSPIKYFKVESDIIPRINEQELQKIVSGAYNGVFDQYVIVDCRFDYEFDGGHIINAVNASSQKDLEEIFLKDCQSGFPSKKQLLIFHCEFSVFRGPNMASYLRKRDRLLNKDCYPILSYPDVVVLEGGYKRFYENYKQSCEPQGYIEMHNSRHHERCEEELHRVRQSLKIPSSKAISSDLLNHGRSHSFSVVTSHAANSKILKRQRSSSRVFNSLDKKQYEGISENQNDKDKRYQTLSRTRSALSYSSTKLFSPAKSPLGSDGNIFEEAFAPPSTTFRSAVRSVHNSKFSSSSINSSNTSICSDQVYPSSSTESLGDSYLDSTNELTETSGKADYLNTKKVGMDDHLHFYGKTSILFPIKTRPKGALPALPALSKSISDEYGTATSFQSTEASMPPYKFPRHKPNLKIETSRERSQREF